ncbi:MAG: YlmH/Sll1252 family protein [Lachnospiraceae bacterium]
MEETLQKKRFLELANRAYQQNIYTYTGFIGTMGQDVLQQIKKDLYFIPYTCFGGVEYAHRVVVAFGDKEELGYEPDFPVVCLQIAPVQKKFADVITHRDILGVIMNLGVERDVLGDILVADNIGYVFCLASIAPYLIAEIDRVKHTTVKVSRIEPGESLPEPKKQTEEMILASQRLDVVIAAVFHLSRKDVLEMFRNHKIYVNGRLFENNSAKIPEDAVISVRGFGRFIFHEVLQETRKGRLRIRISRFI